MSDMATGQDADFSEDRLLERYNTDLANSLGNLLNRTLQMTIRFCNGALHPDRASKIFTDYGQKWEQSGAWRVNVTSSYESYTAGICISGAPNYRGSVQSTR